MTNSGNFYEGKKMENEFTICTDHLNVRNGEKPVMQVYVTGLMDFGDLFFLQSLMDDAGIDYQWMYEQYVKSSEQDDPARLYIDKEKMDLVLDVLKDFEIQIFNSDEHEAEIAEQDKALPLSSDRL